MTITPTTQHLAETLANHPLVSAVYDNAELIRLGLAVPLGAVILFRAVRFVASMVLLPSQAVGMNGARLTQLREAFKRSLEESDPRAEFEELAVPILSSRRLPLTRTSPDGKQTRPPTLDVVFVRHSASLSPSSPLILYLNANGMCYEDVISDAYTLSRALGRNLVMMNYRGVGRSEARTICGNDLVEDVVSVLKYLEQEYYVLSRDILIWGHSIGGAAGVAAAVRTNHAGGLMSDRSFYKLSLVVKQKIQEGPMAPGICGMVAALMTLEVAVIHLIAFRRMGPWPALADFPDSNNMWMWRVLTAGMSLAWVASIRIPAMSFARAFVLGSASCVVVGDVLDKLGLVYASSLPSAVLFASALFFEIGARGWLDRLLMRLVSAIGWEMEAKWGEVPSRVVKMASFHPQDEMIPLSASLSNLEPSAVTMAGKYAAPALLMEGRRVAGPICHMYFPDVEEWRRLGVIDKFRVVRR